LEQYLAVKAICELEWNYSKPLRDVQIENLANYNVSNTTKTARVRTQVFLTLPHNVPSNQSLSSE
jgi:hypothetical protein